MEPWDWDGAMAMSELDLKLVWIDLKSIWGRSGKSRRHRPLGTTNKLMVPPQTHSLHAVTFSYLEVPAGQRSVNCARHRANSCWGGNEGTICHTASGTIWV